jgi:hypothetical protein
MMMVMLAIDDYRGRFGSQRPTQQQKAILERQGVRQDIIERLSREEAFQLIRKGIKRWLQEQEEQALKRQHYQQRLRS